MKIKEFSIIRYGPLPNTGRILLQNFTLFFGKNEDGKTLTIDAIVKLLLGRHVKDFNQINRVEENPEGYVMIEDDEGKEIKLPEKGNLTQLSGLTPSECRNVFIIRNSDLAISDESQFYAKVTDRLTGLRTEDISRIKEGLRELGKITPSGMFRDIRNENIRKRVENAKNLIEEIGTLAKRINEEKFDELEEGYASRKDESTRINEEIKNLEIARKREKYEQAKEALDNLANALKDCKRLEIYNESDERLWRSCEQDVKIHTEEKGNLLAEIKEAEEELKEMTGKLDSAEESVRVLDERKKKIDNEIMPELREYQNRRSELAQQEVKTKFFTSFGIVAVILVGISLLATIWSPALLSQILATVFFVLAAISAALKFQFVREKARLAGMLERNKLILSRLGLSAEDIEGILLNIQRFDEEYRGKYDQWQDIKRKKEYLEGKIKELRDERLAGVESKINSANAEILGIKINSREQSLEEYVRKLDAKREVEKRIGEQESILRTHLGRKTGGVEENISYWEEETVKLEQYKDKAQGVKYSEAAASELERQSLELENVLQDIGEKMQSLQVEMAEVERKVNDILLVEDEHLHCKTSVDLQAVKGKLQGFVRGNESNREHALEVIKIFDEIEMEEREKVAELFGKESPVSDYFHSITNGVYEEVTLNQQEGKIEVKHVDGEILGAEKLSGGAYDQLYLSIRLALGEKLLKGKKGFFIMDDPLVKADPDRLRRQVDVLKKISGMGWQVAYFSAKGEVKDILKEDIDKGSIKYVEVQGICS